jgi:hypothetical protein
VGLAGLQPNRAGWQAVLQGIPAFPGAGAATFGIGPSPNVDSALGMKGGHAQPVAVAQGHGAAAASDLRCDKAFAAGGPCGSR